MMMGSGATVDQSIALADVVISPDAAGVGLLEFHQIDAMRESGRTAARAALPAIHALLARRAPPARSFEPTPQSRTRPS